MVESRRDEDREKDPLQSDSAEVVSDRRARRKRKRGEDVVRVAEDDLATGEDIETDYDDDDEVAVTTAPKGTPTQSRRAALQARARSSSAAGENLPVVGRVVSYLRGVIAEVQKVTWPTPDEARYLTLIVLGVTIAFSVVLGAIDLFYGWWFQQGVHSTTTFLGVAIPFFLIAGFLVFRFIISEEA